MVRLSSVWHMLAVTYAFIKSAKTNGDRAFAHATPVLWNALPPSLKAVENITSFKKFQLKTHLFGKAYFIFRYCRCFFFSYYYVNSRRNVDSEKIRVPDGIWTHDHPWSSRMLYHWATGGSVVSKGQIVDVDWNRIARLHSHVLTHMNSLTASRCHIKASHMTSP